VEEDRRILHRAALLHDIGKIGISELLLNKPGALTPEEQKIMREQSDISSMICAPMRSTPQILPIIRHIHERVDGAGYPDHLVGEQIPLGARIISVADAYDAMTSQRPYRPALPMSKAKSLLSQGGGTQWDMRIVEIFLDRLENDPNQAQMALSA
jgi:HD-GYP domain-containing protein (c-di-GMP phosphodiesterase class II)